MKIIYVVDCITDLNQKINKIITKFGQNIFYVVKADFVPIFTTYGLSPSAVYYKNLTEVTHSLLVRGEIEDVLICYASLNFNNKLLTTFANKIGNKSKIVNLMPKYNYFEQLCNSTYNVYVNSLFKTKDSLISPKLQFIPSMFVSELLSSHLGNRLFELNSDVFINVDIEDKEINKTSKVKSHSIKYDLISIIIALTITIGLIASIAYYKISFIIIFACVIGYILDLLLTLIFHCKAKFDQRFLRWLSTFI